MEKIPKEQWFKMSQEERDHLTFEFNKSVEQRKKWTIIITRAIAILCVLALLFIGVIQWRALEEYGKIKDQYGQDAFCYLCGLEELKKCECQYYSVRDGLVPTNKTEVGLALAEYNTQSCKGMHVDNSGSDFIPIAINLTDLS